MTVFTWVGVFLVSFLLLYIGENPNKLRHIVVTAFLVGFGYYGVAGTLSQNVRNGVVIPIQVSCWQFGSVELCGEPNPSPNLVISSSQWGRLDVALDSFEYVGKVGGVAFEAVASPSSKLDKKELLLSYNKENTDGKRFSIKIGEDTYDSDLPDWQLVPIAIYANSEFTACVSLFGPKSNEERYDIIYHPAFVNTLLGLRLLQADILFMNIGGFSRLPLADGKVIYGLGESEKSNVSILNVSKVMRILQSEKFRFWVFTDNNVNVEFNTDSNIFHLTGMPYYHFWNIHPKYDAIQQEIENNKRRIAEIDALIQGQRLLQLRLDIDKLEELKGLISKRNKIVEETNKLISQPPPVMRSNTITDKMREVNLLDLNQSVYQAATNVMRFSAFFRYVKKTYPKNWTTFMKQISTADRLYYSYTTPTVWAKQKNLSHHRDDEIEQDLLTK